MLQADCCTGRSWNRQILGLVDLGTGRSWNRHIVGQVDTGTGRIVVKADRETGRLWYR